MLIPLFLFLGKDSQSQGLRDTIVTKNKKNIICKVTKITDTDIEYKKDTVSDAIIYTTSKNDVMEIRLGNGKIETIVPDEMEMNHEAQIINKRSSIKVHFFSPLYHYLAFTYERSIRMGTNLEGTFGLINTSMFNFSSNTNVNPVMGGTIVIGPKFILGHSFYIKGMKYSHPLKGSYIKPELILTTFTEKGLNNYYGPTYSGQPTNLRTNSVAILLTYGNQYILGNILTFGFNFGIGYAFVYANYTNPLVNNYMTDPSSNISNLYNQEKIPDIPLSFTGSVTIGYIFK